MAGDGETKQRAREVLRRLERAVPDPRCELRHEGPWQLLIATILSAQSTDARVNQVTPALFERFPNPAALGAAKQDEVEALVRSTGFYRNKARHSREASRTLAERHGGQVPRDLDALVQLPGVARKTANLVLGTACGVATGIVVDTHVKRVAQRLALTGAKSPEPIERDLTTLYPQTRWVDAGHRLLLHGRYLCVAKAPRCAQCPLAEHCPSAGAEPEGRWTERADAEAAHIAEQFAAHGA